MSDRGDLLAGWPRLLVLETLPLEPEPPDAWGMSIHIRQLSEDVLQVDQDPSTRPSIASGRGTARASSRSASRCRQRSARGEEVARPLFEELSSRLSGVPRRGRRRLGSGTPFSGCNAADGRGAGRAAAGVRTE
jgi:hypothetical protein